MRLFAPAKLNLALHVTGRRDDGYHLLDSLVVFVGAGDWIDLQAAEARKLTVTGPRQAGVPTGQDNLAWRAVDLFDAVQGVHIQLEKHLPNAGGIGGGSADAAAVLRGLARLWGVPLPDSARQLALGADIPVCTVCNPRRMRGIGERLSAVPPLPPLWVVLANAGVPVRTGSVFRALATADNPPLPDPDWTNADGLLAWLKETRNDLEGPAASSVPEVEAVLAALRDLQSCRFARMSGSGGTCFGIFDDEPAARTAAAALSGDRPSWWVTAAPILKEVETPT